jgi:hypothetical protein
VKPESPSELKGKQFMEVELGEQRMKVMTKNLQETALRKALFLSKGQRET